MSVTFCDLCRRNVDVKGHHFTRLHQGSVRAFLGKAEQELVPVRAVVAGPRRLPAGVTSTFWCRFCTVELEDDADGIAGCVSA